MSHTIEFARQFIRSDEGITPCWLVGDNNLTENRGRYERVVRQWSCFHNFVGAAEKDIMDAAQSLLGGYQHHWKRNGKWVDDKALTNWIRSGIRSAASVEDILRWNPECCGNIHCRIHVWRGFNHTVEEDTYVSTTAELDDWIHRYQALKEQLNQTQTSVYPCIDFGIEKVRSPLSASDGDMFYFRMNRRLYLTKICENETCWGKDSNSALIFPYEEALDLFKAKHFYLTGVSLVKVHKNQASCAVIKVTDRNRKEHYVYQITPKRMLTSGFKEAHRYSSPKAAQLACGRILEKYSGIKATEVVVL